MSKPKVLITSWMVAEDSAPVQRLREAGFEVVSNHWHGGRNEEELISLLPGISGVVASVDPFTARVQESADSLRVVSRTGVGYDTIDVSAATARGVVVTTTPGANDRAVADFAFTLVLAVSRQLQDNVRNVKEGRWVRAIGDDVADKTIGIVGLGAIGKRVARRAAGFDMRILAYDVIQDPAFAAANGVTYVSLDDLLAEADVVSLHLPLNNATRQIIDEGRLRRMKPTAYLVNTSRGGVVDEAALYRALTEGWIAGAGLDVFTQEPPWGSPLLGLDNVIATPHVAGISKGAQNAMSAMACENTLRVLQGLPPLHAVNPEVFAAR